MRTNGIAAGNVSLLLYDAVSFEMTVSLVDVQCSRTLRGTTNCGRAVVASPDHMCLSNHFCFRCQSFTFLAHKQFFQ